MGTETVVLKSQHSYNANRQKILPIVGKIAFDENACFETTLENAEKLIALNIGLAKAGKGTEVIKEKDAVDIDEHLTTLAEEGKSLEEDNEEDIAKKSEDGDELEPDDKEDIAQGSAEEVDEIEALIEKIKGIKYKDDLVDLAKQGDYPESEWITKNKEPLRTYLIGKLSE